MLASLLDGNRIYAAVAQKGPDYRCPACQALLILKKGEIKIHHFAHRPPVDCALGQGETLAHLEAKLALHAAFAPRAHRAEMEWPLESLSGDRRADLFIWEMRGARLAFELQHTSISAEEITARSAAYMDAGIAVMWLPFLRPRYRAGAERLPAGEDGDWIIRNYRPLPFERWLHLFQSRELWYWAPRTRMLMRGRLEGRGNGRGEKALRLWGPYAPQSLAFQVSRRKGRALDNHWLPGGPMLRMLAP